MTTFSPSIAPSEGYYLPPQAAPSITFAPTLDGSVSKNPAIHFRITALAFLFSLSGIIFTLILIHQSIVFLLKKRWDNDDVSKWELDHQNEERHRLLEEIENGTRKPEKGIQFDENDRNDSNVKLLEPSWIREKDFSMQWEDPTTLEISESCKVLIANANRWKSEEKKVTNGIGSGRDDHVRSNALGGGVESGLDEKGGKTARVVKKNKKIAPNIFEKGCEVIIKTPHSHTSSSTQKVTLPIRYRPARIISMSNDGKYEIEYTDTDGGQEKGIPQDAIQPMTEFNFDHPQRS